MFEFSFILRTIDSVHMVKKNWPDQIKEKPCSPLYRWRVRRSEYWLLQCSSCWIGALGISVRDVLYRAFPWSRGGCKLSQSLFKNVSILPCICIMFLENFNSFQVLIDQLEQWYKVSVNICRYFC